MSYSTPHDMKLAVLCDKTYKRHQNICTSTDGAVSTTTAVLAGSKNARRLYFTVLQPGENPYHASHELLEERPPADEQER